MSSLKSDRKLVPRAMLNTTINKEVLEEFKSNCKENGIQMNTLIEAFMRQYNDGEFTLQIKRQD